jgi:hypothetical protein
MKRPTSRTLRNMVPSSSETGQRQIVLRRRMINPRQDGTFLICGANERSPFNGTVASCSSCFRMLSDDNEVQMKTIETHLRRLGLTEEQIALHLAPLRAKNEKPQPIRRKAGTPSSAITYFMRPSRKPQLAS